MSDVESAWRILHIAGDGPSGSVNYGHGEFGGAGAPAAFAGRVDRCDSLYVALARLLRDESRTFCAAVVCVDGIAEEDLEFFSLLRRHRPDVEVLVYSRSANDRAVQAAVERGAIVCSEATLRRVADRAASRGPRTVAQVSGSGRPQPVPVADRNVHREWEIKPASDRGLAPEQRMPPRTAEVVTANAPAEPKSAREEVPLVASAGVPAEPPNGQNPDNPVSAVERNGHEAGEATMPDENQRGPARVPWMRYADAPARRKPPAAPPVDGEVSQLRVRPGEDQALPSTVERPDPFAPLLTQEELRALMSDDFADVGADERESLLGDEPSGPPEGAK